MPTILDHIVDSTRSLVAARRREIPVHTLENQPGFFRTPRSLAEALRPGGKPSDSLRFIAECKKASPSKGIIRTEYDPAAHAVAYEAAGASAVSVLTEPAFFQGSLDHLAAARSRVELPLLRKDFVVDRYQLVEARAFGADAVLLIASILEPNELADLHDAAEAIGLSCLVECYEESELEKLDFAQVRVVGVNNRNLHTFEVDRGHAARVLAQVPEAIVRVAESGLRTAADFAAMRRAGLDAVLVGEAFMRAPDPGEALARLRAETGRLIESITGSIHS